MVSLEKSTSSKVKEEDVANGTTFANGIEVSSPVTHSGMRCDIKNLYQGEEDRRGRFTWVDKYPEDWEEAAENAETARYALLVRNKKSFSMAYDELSASSRRHVWSNFLKNSTQTHEFSDADLDRLAEYPMNGRQIKNVLKTAQLLASRKSTPLRLEYVDTVLSIEKKRRVLGGA